MIRQKNIQRLLKNCSVIFLFIFSFVLSAKANADLSKCKDPELQEKVRQVAKEKGVDSNELLSVIAHESKCNYFVIAWNFPGAPRPAKNKFFQSLEEAKVFAEELIRAKKYRIDVGIGQINYEANIKRKDWSLEEVLDSKTALNRVAQILKERSWARYHSANPFYARQWKKLALEALSRVSYSSSMMVNEAVLEKKENGIVGSNFKLNSVLNKKKAFSPLVVYNSFSQKFLMPILKIEY